MPLPVRTWFGKPAWTMQASSFSCWQNLREGQQNLGCGCTRATGGIAECRSRHRIHVAGELRGRAETRSATRFGISPFPRNKTHQEARLFSFAGFLFFLGWSLPLMRTRRAVPNVLAVQRATVIIRRSVRPSMWLLPPSTEGVNLPIRQRRISRSSRAPAYS